MVPPQAGFPPLTRSEEVIQDFTIAANSVSRFNLLRVLTGDENQPSLLLDRNLSWGTNWRRAFTVISRI
jgi:hypothetical protein